MPRTFADDELEQHLATNGYVKLRGFDREQVAELEFIYQRFHQGDRALQLSDVDWLQPEQKRSMADTLAPLWQHIFDSYEMPYRSLATGFVAKRPGPEGPIPAHCHFTCVDEEQHRSIVTWAAVDRTNEALDNGPVQVLPGSHLVTSEYFGSFTDPWYRSWRAEVQHGLVAIDMEPGDVLVMDSRLVHASDVNRSTGRRLGLYHEAVPLGASLFHAVGIEGEHVELHTVAPDYLLEAAPGVVAFTFGRYHAPDALPPDLEVGSLVPHGSVAYSVEPKVRRPLDTDLLLELCRVTKRR